MARGTHQPREHRVVRAHVWIGHPDEQSYRLAQPPGSRRGAQGHIGLNDAKSNALAACVVVEFEGAPRLATQHECMHAHAVVGGACEPMLLEHRQQSMRRVQGRC